MTTDVSAGHRVAPGIGIHRCAWFVVVAIFALSLIVRAPLIGEPLPDGGHHWLTATVLRTDQIWAEEGAFHYRFLPIMSYGLAADKNIANHAEMVDQVGDYYYTSYPPFSYIAPYVVIRAFGGMPDVASLQWFGVGVHFVTILLLFQLMLVVLKPRSAWEYVGPVIGIAAYIFTLETLWFHTTVYMADMFVQTLFAATVLLATWLLTQESEPSTWLYVLAGVVSFITVWSEWIGVFTAVAVFLVVVMRRFDPRSRKLLIYIGIGTAAGIILYLAHYSLVDGFSTLWKFLVDKYLVRSGSSGTSTYTWWDPESWRRIFKHYRSGYTWVLGGIALLGAPVLLVLSWSRKTRVVPRTPLTVALWLLVLPVLMHHIVFFDFTAVHEFSVLKSGLPFSLVLAALVTAVVAWVERRGWPALTAGIAVAFVSVAAWLSIGVAKDYAGLYANADYTGMEIGESVAALARPDEVVVVDLGSYTKFRPQLVLYAHRNIQLWSGESDALELVDCNEASGAVVFHVDESGEIVVERISRR